MSKKRVHSLLITKMGEEVFELFACQTEFSEKAFHPAFRDVAHKHHIWHHEDAAEYNRYFGWVMEEVKVLIQKNNHRLARKVRVSPQQRGPQQQIRTPVLNPHELKYTRDLF